MDKPVFTKLGMLIPRDQEQNTVFYESVLISTPCEGGSCSSDRKATITKTVLISSAAEDMFFFLSLIKSQGTSRVRELKLADVSGTICPHHQGV
jgi:hypothetical protein